MLNEKAVEQDLPPTLTVLTGGRGRHRYYKTNLDRKIILYDENGEHLGEIQAGDGCYVVGPGSLHSNGRRYELVEDRFRLADLRVD